VCLVPSLDLRQGTLQAWCVDLPMLEAAEMLLSRGSVFCQTFIATAVTSA